MLKKQKRKILVLIMFFVFFFTPYQRLYTRATDPEPFFSISIIAPTSNYQEPWIALVVEQLPKIGIAVDVLDYASLTQISSRVWEHSGPYPIPTYSEGGYDVLFHSWIGDFDWNPKELYNSSAITPNGNNFYQYSNPIMDQAISTYTSSYTINNRIARSEAIQAILFEDLPAIPIAYLNIVYPHREQIEWFEGLLWSLDFYPFHNLNYYNTTEFHYATYSNFEIFHPHMWESISDAQWLSQIYSGLLLRNSSLYNAYGPWLAENFGTNDGITYYVKIKDGAKWADGTSLTTDDVIFNYQLAVSPAVGNRDYLHNVQYWDNDSFTKITEKEFTIKFLQPYVFQDNNLALRLIPKHIWSAVSLVDFKETAENWAQEHPEKMFGAGPYMLNHYNSSSSVIHLVANPYFADWYGVDPSFDDIYFEFFSDVDTAITELQSYEIDMIDYQFNPTFNDIFSSSSEVTATLVPSSRVYELAINMRHPYLGTGESCPIAGTESARFVRKAISYLIPRNYICDELPYNGVPAATSCPYSTIGRDNTLEEYLHSLLQAQISMNLAGFDITWSSVSSLSMLNKLGITLSIVFIVLILAFLVGRMLFTSKKP